MKVGLVTEIDIHRKEAWSGTILHMVRALEAAEAQVDILGPIYQTETRALRRLDKLVRKVTGGDPMLNRTAPMVRRKGRRLARLAQQHNVDVIFAPVGSTLIADLPPHGPPVLYTSDATMKLMFDYYDWFGAPTERIRDRAIASERAAMQRADLLIYPTAWAAQSAIEDYGIDPARLMVQPFGANMFETPPRSLVLGPRKPGPLQLLFCGVQWARKGGDIVIETAEHLLEQGVELELTVLGCTPPETQVISDRLRRHTTIIPYLNKNIPEESARFRNIFAAADLLLLPTRADCYGLVFCEASAFATVSVGTQTGGVPEVIRDGETGLVLPLEARGAEYAEAIRQIVVDPDRLARMRRAARDDFETRLNWQVWARAVLERIPTLGPRETATR